MRRQGAVEEDPAQMRAADLMERLKRRVWRHFDVVIYPSEEEAVTVRKMDPRVLACGITPFYFDPFP